MFVCIVRLSYPSRTYETGSGRDVRKNTLVRVSVLLLDRSRFRSADSSDCLVEDSGVGLVVAAVTRTATTHELLLQTLSLFPALFPVRSVSAAIYLSTRVLAPMSLIPF